MNLEEAMTIKLDYELPEYPAFDPQYRRAPRRESHLSESDKALAIKKMCIRDSPAAIKDVLQQLHDRSEEGERE